ncbi:EscU/YscU/HrcU family type III secretion system export apparatus switch protein [Leptospira sp. 2 VSF19]|uniref:EscU/YscU/HrcU family type III secretion system export apparatus switch protein n=1 Tax=Leptospira soteropolitanensis TaxID=2950025 RepID=A0AAW5VN34_9LEPT|nr:EscU/YscU/HrcU family type III secretion system export apparatus switch protein [Leptospira soteropolitanensis]MCW7492215.1 EscU/YscU/HrcU family type III secretion system export apparatus switch protein [Leptospira soteropolitanensis]MCW7499797.1 EscU/YscU/HrcU family type III secretion system export apparatus switch protein [Leptospira soteropolitanensis]MCW7522048.1 EscU/YscU/HrcU family type III secretion system export apparatus switch protein [Leptospira soteropolitanensis]MCW7525902.1 
MKQKMAALAYDPARNAAPKLVAKAEGRLATNLIQIARESGVLVIQDEVMMQTLDHLPNGKEIPRDLYEVVAAVFRILVLERQKKNN